MANSGSFIFQKSFITSSTGHTGPSVRLSQCDQKNRQISIEVAQK